MLSKCDFLKKAGREIRLLDGATGTALIAAGMPKICCKEAWILEHPEVIIHLQQRYAEAGSDIVYAPTFQANPLALKNYGLDAETELMNARLAALSRAASPNCLIAGNLTTLRMYVDSGDAVNFERITAVYRRQIRGLVDGGVDLLAAETLLNPLEAKAVLHAAELENIPTVMISFALKSDGTLRSGHDAETVFTMLEEAGASAAGMNCIAADNQLPGLVCRLKSKLSIPLICKPNAGRAVSGIYPVDAPTFATVMQACIRNGVDLAGGCCGTAPEHIAALKSLLT